LTSEEESEDAPAFSPDGKQLVFISDRAPPDGGAAVKQVYLLDLGSRQVTRLTSGAAPADTPTWTPDGKHVLYFLRTSDAATAGLHSMNPDGSGDRFVHVASGEAGGFVGGKLLTNAPCPEQGLIIATLALLDPNAATGTGCQVNLGADALFIQPTAFPPPNGGAFAFLWSCGPQIGLYATSLGSAQDCSPSNPHLSLDSDGSLTDPAAGPDGMVVAASLMTNGLVTAKLGAQGVHPLTMPLNPAIDRRPTWAPAGVTF
jgi:hypothetical protein